jgi:hypothetical protein
MVFFTIFQCLIKYAAAELIKLWFFLTILSPAPFFSRGAAGEIL